MESKALQYVCEAIEGFIADPPDNDFLRGYLRALEVIYVEAFEQNGSNRLAVQARYLSDKH
jgi:hypothetical protein